MSSIEAKIRRQKERMHFIETLAQEEAEGFFNTLPLQVVLTKLEILEKQWTTFEETHDSLADRTEEQATSYDYFTKQTYVETLTKYALARSALLIRHDDLEATRKRSNSTSSTTPAAPTQRRTLPEISLPKFSGEFAEWRPFRDLFTSMVLNNQEISAVEKMHYLRTTLSGEAAQLIANLSISEDSLEIAWDSLTTRFENKRLLIAAHLDKLFGSMSISTRTAKEFNLLLNSTTEALNALRALDLPVQHWDAMLVHLLVQHLDTRTREAWEMKLGTSTNSPTFQELRDFLTGRARALESIELCNSRSTGRRPSITVKPTTGTSYSRVAATKAHVATTSSGSSEQYPCAHCSETTHYIVNCKKFRMLTPTQRREFVTKARLCYNCLGWHNVAACKSSKRCQLCDHNHHTMIHVNEPRYSSSRTDSTPENYESARSSPLPRTSATTPSASSSPPRSDSGDSKAEEEQ